MKKKINGLADLTVQFLEEKNITLSQFLELFKPYVTARLGSGFIGGSYADWRYERTDGTKYQNKIVFTVDIKVKKKERKKIKRILSSNQTDNHLSFFYHIEYGDDDEIVSKELRFRNNQMYRFRDFKLYDFLYEFRKILPNLIIDLEMMLYGSL